MNPITYLEATDVAGAIGAIGSIRGTDANEANEAIDHRYGPARAFIAGGTNLIDLMKEQVMRPQTLVDVNGLRLDTITPSEAGGLLLGATARNADTAYHPLVRDGYPLLTAAILAGASPQIRNMASNGGKVVEIMAAGAL
jgi:xanthine dehydrogenase YagS FAD-binding subunit